ncbi:MAG: hypothetical protein IJI36_01655 [Kiritimatiellae bacterium]|nr:hypothetical protein [Kiritimatiellia bacterium]
MKRALFCFLAMAAGAACLADAASRLFGEEGGVVRMAGLHANFHPHGFRTDWSGVGAKGSPFAGKDGLYRWTLSPSGSFGPKINGTLAMSGKGDRTAHLEWTFTPEADVEMQELAVSAEFGYAELRGGKVVADGKQAILPVEKPAKPQIAYLWTSRVRVVDASGAMRCEMSFAKPRGVLVQDNRAWGVDGISLRFAARKEKPFRAGVAYTVALDYSAPEPFAIGRPDPVVISAGPDWIPMAPGGDIAEGSALDFSSLRGTECPAGKYGRVLAKGQNFEFEKKPGVPQRFYGVNVCGYANLPPTIDDARRFAARLRKTGYNALRLHHHESVLVAKMGDPSATTVNPERMRMLDGLVAACVENGIYLTTDFFVSRSPIMWRSIGVDRDGSMSMGEAKAWLFVHDGMHENLFRFVRNWLGHVNEFTGRRLADEPALAWISLVNEAAQGGNTDFLSRQEPWREAWRRWLAGKKAADPGFYGDIDDAFPVPDPAHGKKWQAYILFLQETESAFAAKVTRFMREDLKCKALLTNLNGVWFPLAYQYCKEADYDYVDDHFYVDHPQFLEKSWQLPSKCPNVNPLANGNLGVQGMAFRRVLNRPFTCSEYNYAAPGRFRGVGGIVTGALGALQGWAGLWRFAWSHDLRGITAPEKKSLNYFDMSGDPLGLASERASICLFLRRDLSELSKTYAIHLPCDLVRKPNPHLSGWAGAPFTWAGWYAKVGTQLGEKAPEGTIPAGTYPDLRQRAREAVFADLGMAAPQDDMTFPVAGDGAISIDRATGAFSISTPRTCGGFAESGTVRTKFLSADLEGSAATVWASSLDGAPLDESAHILLTHLTDVQNSGITYIDAERRVLSRWGRLPHLMRRGVARCRLRTSGGAWKAHALSPDGSRRREVPISLGDGTLGLVADVAADPASATYLYELVRLPAR